MKQTAILKQSQHLSPQQLQVAKLVQASSDELEQLIREEVENNFALEIDDCSSSADCERQQAGEDRDTDQSGYEEEQDERREDGNEEEDRSYDDVDSSINYADDDYEPEPAVSADNEGYSPIINYVTDKSFRDELFAQLDVLDLTKDEDFLARYLVDSLDDSGYLRRDLADLVDDLDFYQHFVTTVGELERVLVEIVQTLDPIGVGARDLKECLLLQIQEKTASPTTELAYEVVSNAFEDLAAHRHEKICHNFGCSERQLSEVVKLISRLVAKPGISVSDTDHMESRAAHIKADFRIHEENGELKVMLNDSYLPEVRISADSQEMLERIQKDGAKSKDEKEGLALLKEKIAAGNQFIDSLVQRHRTLSAVIKAIVGLQRDYFISGCSPEMLRPMVLQDVADRSGYDVSTISRVSNSKFIQTDYQTIAVKDLFTAGVQTEQGNVSNKAIMDCLKEMIDNEDKKNPLSDDALSEGLKEKGYPVARRTVTKYREKLNYPTARLRRTI